MSSDLEIALRFLVFVGKWSIGWVISNPHVLIICISVAWITRHFWQQLKVSESSSKSCFSSTSCFLVLMIFSGILWDLKTAQKVGELRGKLSDAQSKIQLGSHSRDKFLDELKNLKLQQSNDADTVAEENPLDGCLHVFIDLGANRGLQIRKLYEPNHFPLSPVLTLFDRFFGKPDFRKLQEICSVAFEPNPKHAEHLRSLSEAYASCGINVLIYMAGVGSKDSKSRFAPFNTLLGSEVGHDTAARLIRDGESMEQYTETHFHEDVDMIEVDVIRFATFITDVVAKRKLPTSAGVHVPRVVIKADIEGAELEILPDMIVTGALSHVDNIHMEWHDLSSYRQGREAAMISKLAPAITNLAELTKSEDLQRKFEIEEMDDETYCGLLIYKPWGDYTQLLEPPSCG